MKLKFIYPDLIKEIAQKYNMTIDFILNAINELQNHLMMEAIEVGCVVNLCSEDVINYFVSKAELVFISYYID